MRTGPDQTRSVKDRAQAQDRPDAVPEALAGARANGPLWGKRIAVSLRRMPQSAALLAVF